mmetsp:Transcript_42769/g.167145  ORF Transcript_42769/g.167145 Transcript_42769/m.167145 type:complete len:225 (-) Transcript_42769:2118-2792(-)
MIAAELSLLSFRTVSTVSLAISAFFLTSSIIVKLSAAKAFSSSSFPVDASCTSVFTDAASFPTLASISTPDSLAIFMSSRAFASSFSPPSATLSTKELRMETMPSIASLSCDLMFFDIESACARFFRTYSAVFSECDDDRLPKLFDISFSATRLELDSEDISFLFSSLRMIWALLYFPIESAVCSENWEIALWRDCWLARISTSLAFNLTHASSTAVFCFSLAV